MEIARAFLKASRDDLACAEAVQARFPAQSVFHAQQAAEKAVKAWLFERGVKVTRTHYLSPILARVRHRFPDMTNILRDLADHLSALEDFATDTRYPVSLGQGRYAAPNDVFDREDAGEAVEGARRVLQLIEAKED